MEVDKKIIYVNHLPYVFVEEDDDLIIYKRLRMGKKWVMTTELPEHFMIIVKILLKKEKKEREWCNGDNKTAKTHGQEYHVGINKNKLENETCKTR